jgi:hypothetical protein
MATFSQNLQANSRPIMRNEGGQRLDETNTQIDNSSLPFHNKVGTIVKLQRTHVESMCTPVYIVSFQSC